jgi:hypothetical protein
MQVEVRDSFITLSALLSPNDWRSAAYRYTAV